MLSFGQFIHNINQSAYRLDTIGVVGLFGGDTAASALETIHFYVGQRWAGWYNYPGGMTVAMRFGRMATSRLWNTIFPGPHRSPTHVFNLIGKSGPDFFQVVTGTTSTTGYLGYLIAKQCMTQYLYQLYLLRKNGSKARSSPAGSGVVTIMTLSDIPFFRTGSGASDQAEETQNPGSGPVSLVTDPAGTGLGDSGQAEEIQNRFPACPPLIVSQPPPIEMFIPTTPMSNSNPRLALWSIVPSLASILACVFSFLGHDPLCASLILLGSLSSGFSFLVLGSATLGIYTVVPPTRQRADGLMFPEDRTIIILKGDATELGIITGGDVNSHFRPEYASSPVLFLRGLATGHMIGISSLLLVVQVFVQFILLPRCTFFGQILALISFLLSSAYHFYVASVSPDREGLHRKVLWGTLNLERSLHMEKLELGTRTQMAVFVCLVLGEDHPDSLKTNPDAVLTRITNNDTLVWRHWREKVVKELDRFWKWNAEPLFPYVPSIQVEPEDQTEVDEYSRFTEHDKELLEYLVDDAWCVFNRYTKWRNSESEIWGKRGGGDEENPNTCPGGSPADCTRDHHERHTPFPNKVPVRVKEQFHQ